MLGERGDLLVRMELEQHGGALGPPVELCAVQRVGVCDEAAARRRRPRHHLVTAAHVSIGEAPGQPEDARALTPPPRCSAQPTTGMASELVPDALTPSW